MEIRESQIEDILVNAPELTKKILNLDEMPFLLSRQMLIPSGRLDLLYAYQAKLILIELKVTTFHRNFIKQILDYKSDLLAYQQSGRIKKGQIQPYLLCTSTTESQKKLASDNGVFCTDYHPEQVLQFFYENLRPIAFFTGIKPIDIGIWNLHLIHELLYLLKKTKSVKVLRQLVRNSQRTLYNKIKFANELRLIEWMPNSDSIALSKFGHEYVDRKDKIFPEGLSEAQSDLMRKFVMQNPYESPIVLGIASIVESVFFLSKNTYPVPMSHLLQYFTYYAGKYFDWQTKKAKYNATRMYTNYAVDLGLLAKSGDTTIYLTPEGFRFTIQMQMHKSLKMIDSLKLA
jgi:hypothetical protein